VSKSHVTDPGDEPGPVLLRTGTTRSSSSSISGHRQRQLFPIFHQLRMAAIIDNVAVGDSRTVQLDDQADVWQIMKRRPASHRMTVPQRQKHGRCRVGRDWTSGGGELSTLPGFTSAPGIRLDGEVAGISTGDREDDVTGITDFKLQQNVVPANDVFFGVECFRWLPCSIRSIGLQVRRSRETITEGGCR